ncbi:TspO/MBR related protein [Breoghania corrubedonensis]|uniref:TspO/MBR related protein n=1 Tax=Breoghania corrubedonensis TaxID=665038 RepID=A0A2T5VH12_9HYPH|nr:TspO/MBR family protein [Breoghania corrubedonensis]PTW63041.1 TspO/MBR related protein [Breoghania corrubedonensis]
MRRWIVLALFLVVVLGGGLAIGFATVPGAWYAALQKPAITPPNWLFAPAWTILYVLIAIVGWRTFERDKMGTEMKLWVGQLMLNFTWSPVFFRFQDPYRALVLIVMMLILIFWFLKLTWSRDRVTAWLFVPYVVWSSYATLLNVLIWYMNRDPSPPPLFQ